VLWRSETDERIPNKWWKKSALNEFVKHSKEQLKQRLTEVWSSAQLQTAVERDRERERERERVYLPSTYILLLHSFNGPFSVLPG